MCHNMDKGGPARKACKAACIGCMRCVKACEYGAVTVKNNLAVIDGEKCVACVNARKSAPPNASISSSLTRRAPRRRNLIQKGSFL